MSFVTRLLATRKGAFPVSAALMIGLLGSSRALAECADTFAFPQAAALLPFGQGSSVNSLVSVLNTVNTAFLTNTSAFVSAPGGPQPDQQGGGVWARGIGGNVENKNTGVTTVNVDPGSRTCNTTTRVNYWGFQTGHDISILNGGNTGANWHFGVTAGYFEAHAKDVSSAPPIPTFSGEFQVPFAGVYTAFTKGNFYADAQARWDIYQNELTDTANGLAGQKFDGRGYSLTANAGYRVDLHSNWFVEPSTGVVWSRVKLDPLNVAGPGVFPFTVPGTVQIDDIDSLLGRASIRVGTNFTTGHIAWQPFATASVFHEFAGDVSTTLTTQPGVGINGILTTSRVGTYGQFGLGSAAVIANTGWLGYARVDYRIGENIEGWSVNAGVRYQFTPEAGRGSIKDAPAVAAWSKYNWTGLYAGGFAGMTWGGVDGHYVAGGAPFNPDFAGHFLGGQIGYNVQVNSLVFGIEGDYGVSNANGANSCPNLFFFTCHAEADKLGSLTGRLGTTWGRALFYVKGGLAFGEISATGTPNAVGPGFEQAVLTTKWVTGWTAGGGMEFALTDSWSAKAEYMHYEFGSERYQTGTINSVDASADGNSVRVGVNYHFHRQPDPVALK